MPATPKQKTSTVSGQQLKQGVYLDAFDELYSRIIAPAVGDDALDMTKLENNPEMQQAELEKCKRDVVYWMCNYAHTYDPRPDNQDEREMLMKLFPKQVILVNWIEDLILNKKDGAVTKARDSGVSCVACFIAVHHWLFENGSKIGFGSYTQAKVDQLGDPDSLFEKMRHCIRKLPKWMSPKKLDERKHLLQCRLINPDNGSTIIGEIGDNIGRGGRNRAYFVDEAQPLSAKVMTPTGWRNMGDITVGDKVIGASGCHRLVVGTNDAGVHHTFRFRFMDGTSAECSKNHLWSVFDKKGNHSVKSADDISKDYIRHFKCGQTHYKYKLPLSSPVEFLENAPLPLHPYLVGALIGDGSLAASCIRITSADQEIIDRVAACIPPGCSLKKEERYDYRIVHDNGRGARKTGQKLPLLDGLQEIGLKGLRSYDKHIPEMYLMASRDDRLELLRGLMDTDGSASGGRTTYHTSSQRLSEDVLFLARSLGAIATCQIKPDHRGYRDQYQVYIVMPDGVSPFWLTRKTMLIPKTRKHNFSKTIIGVDELGEQPVKCISIDGPDGLYITDGFSVTHNSAFLEHPDMADSALTGNTPCRIDISTPNGLGNWFYRKVQKLPKEQVFEFRWEDDPRKDLAWKEKTIKEKGPIVFEREFNLNFAASLEGICIPSAWVKAATEIVLPDIEDELVIGFDVAAEGDNLNAMAPRRGPKVHEIISWQNMNTFQTAMKAAEEAERLGATKVYYDNIGVGSAIHGAWSAMNDDQDESRHLPFEPVGVTGGDKPSERVWPDGKTSSQKFANVRAEMYWTARERFEKSYEYWLYINNKPGGKMHDFSDMISIPANPQLMAELSTPLIKVTASGKIQIESKIEMRRRGVRSPDLADAVIYSLYPKQQRRAFWFI